MSRSPHGAHRRPGRRSRLAPVCTALLLLGVATLGWAATQQVGPPPAPPVAGSTATSSTSTGRATTGRTDRSSTTSPTMTAMPASAPTAVRIPSIDVRSPINPIGLDSQGRLKVPSGEDYDEVAWYQGSPTPGEVGPSVLEGHVTGSGHDPSVFFELGDLRAGDRIVVDREDGTTAVFEVATVQLHPKGDFPTATVYGHVDEPELRIITCGGTYDPDARRHLSNVVVSARLVRG